jgi:hypothetical protein
MERLGPAWVGWAACCLLLPSGSRLLAPQAARVEAQPCQVLLLRHGHKDPNRGDFNLSPRVPAGPGPGHCAAPLFGPIGRILTL